MEGVDSLDVQASDLRAPEICRIFRNLVEVRDAVAAFVELYNEQWRVEKLGFLTPNEVREAWGRREAA